MPISQADRDHLEDLQLDPLGDHTEILHPSNANGPGLLSQPEANGSHPNR